MLFRSGVVCAARAMARNAAEIRRMAKNADNAKAEAAAAKAAAEAKARMDQWVCHLVSLTGGVKDYAGQWDVFAMIRKAGGMTAARVGFEA